MVRQDWAFPGLILKKRCSVLGKQKLSLLPIFERPSQKALELARRSRAQ